MPMRQIVNMLESHLAALTQPFSSDAQTNNGQSSSTPDQESTKDPEVKTDEPKEDPIKSQPDSPIRPANPPPMPPIHVDGDSILETTQEGVLSLI